MSPLISPPPRSPFLVMPWGYVLVDRRGRRLTGHPKRYWLVEKADFWTSIFFRTDSRRFPVSLCIGFRIPLSPIIGPGWSVR